MSRSPSQMAETLSGLGRLTELRQRLLFVLGALLVYRIGTFIPVPGVNPEALAKIGRASRPCHPPIFSVTASFFAISSTASSSPLRIGIRTILS